LRERSGKKDNPVREHPDTQKKISEFKSELNHSGVSAKSRASLEIRVENVKKRMEEIDGLLRKKKKRKVVELADALVDYIYSNFTLGEKTDEVMEVESRCLNILEEWDDFLKRFYKRLVIICGAAVILIGIALLYSWSNRDYYRYGSVFEIIDERDFGALRAFLRKNPVYINIKNSEGKTPLDYAIEKGDKVIVKILIRECTDIDARDSEKGETLLHRASLRGDENVVFLLLDKGANVNVKNNMGEYPLHFAVSLKSSMIATTLISAGADVNAVSLDGITPLHIAAEKSDKNMIIYLVSRGARVNVKNKHMRTPLHVATINGNKGAVEALIENKIDIDAKDEMGETALHKSAKYGRPEIAEILIKNGAYINSINNKGQIPLRIAVLKNHSKVARVLRKAER